jgi:hypothetical protein
MRVGRILALGFSPADVESVDPDPVKAVSIGNIASKAYHAGFRGDVWRQIGLSPVCGEGDDVDDRPGCLTTPHIVHCRLHDEERRPQVDGDVSVEELDGGVRQGSTRGDARGVDDAVNPAVAGHSRAHAPGRSNRIGKINSVEPGVGSVAGQLTGKVLTRCSVAPRDHDPGSTIDRGRSGNSGAEPSISSADQDDLVLEEHVHQTSLSLRSTCSATALDERGQAPAFAIQPAEIMIAANPELRRV